MATSPEYLAYVVEMLESLGTIEVQKMFSGALLKVEDKQLGIIINDELYFSLTSDELKSRFTKKGSRPFSYTRKDRQDPVVINKWWKVPDEYLDAPAELTRLGEAVLAQ